MVEVKLKQSPASTHAQMACRLEDVYRVVRRLGRAVYLKEMLTITPVIPRVCSEGVHPRGFGNRLDLGQTAFLSRLTPARSELYYDSTISGLSSGIVLNGKRVGNYNLYPVCSIRTSATILRRVRVPNVTVSDMREEVKQAIVQYMEETLKAEKELVIHITNKSPHFVNRLVEEMKTTFQPGADLNLMVRDVLKKSKFKGVEPYFESIGFTPQEIEKASMYSRYGLAGAIEKVNLFESIGIKLGEIPKVVSTNPRALSNSSHSLKVKVQYLTQLGLSSDDICKLVVSYPKALSFGLKNGRLPLVDFLRAKGVQDSEIGKVVVRCPQLVSLNVEKKLQPAVQTLESVGITGRNLSRVLVTQPSLLRRKLKRNIEYCQSLGLDGKPGVIARLLVTCPNFSEEGCKARMSYLESVGLTREQVVTMIFKNPAWLSFNVESSLSLKVNYLVNVMGKSVQDLVNAANFLTMSLEKRIVPRWTVLSAMEKAGLLKKSYSLSTLATWSNDYFERHFVSKCPQDIKKLWPYAAKVNIKLEDQQPIA